MQSQPPESSNSLLGSDSLRRQFKDFPCKTWMLPLSNISPDLFHFQTHHNSTR